MLWACFNRQYLQSSILSLMDHYHMLHEAWTPALPLWGHDGTINKPGAIQDKVDRYKYVLLSDCSWMSSISKTICGLSANRVRKPVAISLIPGTASAAFPMCLRLHVSKALINIPGISVLDFALRLASIRSSNKESRLLLGYARTRAWLETCQVSLKLAIMRWAFVWGIICQTLRHTPKRSVLKARMGCSMVGRLWLMLGTTLEVTESFKISRNIARMNASRISCEEKSPKW